MYNIEDFEEELKNVMNDLDKQLEALSSDNENFHHSIIDIISNSPKSKEIIQFIVAINDKLETKQDNLKEILRDSLKSLVYVKIKIFREINKEIEKLNTEVKKQSNFEKVKFKASNVFTELKNNFLKNIKTYLFVTLGILFLVAFLVFPDKLIVLLKLYLKTKGL